MFPLPRSLSPRDGLTARLPPRIYLEAAHCNRSHLGLDTISGAAPSVTAPDQSPGRATRCGPLCLPRVPLGFEAVTVRRLQPYAVTIFAEMSALAARVGAVNL